MFCLYFTVFHILHAFIIVFKLIRWWSLHLFSELLSCNHYLSALGDSLRCILTETWIIFIFTQSCKSQYLLWAWTTTKTNTWISFDVEAVPQERVQWIHHHGRRYQPRPLACHSGPVKMAGWLQQNEWEGERKRRPLLWAKTWSTEPYLCS